MAIYHLHQSQISRSSGRSTVQSAAYICGVALHEERRDKSVSYEHRQEDVAAYQTLVPEHYAGDPERLWNDVENFEDSWAEEHFKSEDAKTRFLESAQVGMTIVVALPNMFSVEEGQALVEEFAKERFVARNLCVTYAIHTGEGNLHAHIQVARRGIGEDGKFLPRKDREICTRSALLETRKLWAEMTNAHLAAKGREERITEKSFADLGINLSPGKHVGWYGERLGNDSRVVQENAERRSENLERVLQDPGLIVEKLGGMQGVFTQKDLLREITKIVETREQVGKIFETALAEAVTVGESIERQFLYTSAGYQREEEEAVSRLEELRQREGNLSEGTLSEGTLSEGTLREGNIGVCSEDSVQNTLDRHRYLSAEQRAAVWGITEEANVSVLIGRAGAGKTTTVRAIAEVYQADEHRVVGMSLSALASAQLRREAGIESRTIASWRHAWRMYDQAEAKFLSFSAILTEGVLKQLDWYQDLKRYEGSQLQKGDVLVVDEAGMVGTQAWSEILARAQSFGAKVIAVGDDSQFSAIAAGDFFRHLKETGPVHELCEIRRQDAAYMKEASQAFADLRTREGLAMYERQGHIHGSADLIKDVAEQYLDTGENAGECVVLCPTRALCRAVNDEIRLWQKEAGILGADLATVGSRTFAENDRVVFLRNDARLGVKNGERGEVLGGSQECLRIQTDAGLKDIPLETYQELDHGYALTLHKAQGQTYDRTFVIADRTMEAKATYVAMTRHRTDVQLYYDKETFSSYGALAQTLSRYRSKDLVADHAMSLGNGAKERVQAYRESVCELTEIARGIAREEATWELYGKTKEQSIALGREILSDFDTHKLYLRQAGMTRESLEIAVGLKPRPLSQAELNAQEAVSLYAEAARSSKELFQEMRKDQFDVSQHEDYATYQELRGFRNDLAREILANVPLHREFVRRTSLENAGHRISLRGMENQIRYEDRQRQLALRETNATEHGVLRDHVEPRSVEQSLIEQSLIEQSRIEQSLIERIEEACNGSALLAPEKGLFSSYWRKQEGVLKNLGAAAEKGTSFVTPKMLSAYAREHQVTEKRLYEGEALCTYANHVIAEKLSEGQEVPSKEASSNGGPPNGVPSNEVPSRELVEHGIRQALCFAACRDASPEHALTQENITALHQAAALLNTHLEAQTLQILATSDIAQDALMLSGAAHIEPPMPQGDISAPEIPNLQIRERHMQGLPLQASRMHEQGGPDRATMESRHIEKSLPDHAPLGGTLSGSSLAEHDLSRSAMAEHSYTELGVDERTHADSLCHDSLTEGTPSEGALPEHTLASSSSGRTLSLSEDFKTELLTLQSQDLASAAKQAQISLRSALEPSHESPERGFEMEM